MDKKTIYDRTLNCRYYNGEEKCPDGINEMFWGYEQSWVLGHHEHWDMEKEDLKRLGLEYFEATDGTPYEIKCLLFNRYAHWIGIHDNGESFLKWYIDTYQKPRLTNRQRRALHRKEKLIKSCRLYKGEEKNPYEGTDLQMTWYYEQCWVENLSNSYTNAEVGRNECKHWGLEDLHKKYGVPRSLIGLLVNRYIHWHTLGPDVHIEYFRDWFENVYMKFGN